MLTRWKLDGDSNDDSEQEERKKRGLELSRLPRMDLTFEWSRTIENKCCSPTCVLAARWKITSMFSVLKMWFTSRELHTSPCRGKGDLKSCTCTCTTTTNLPAALWSLNCQSSSSSPSSFGGKSAFPSVKKLPNFAHRSGPVSVSHKWLSVWLLYNFTKLF